jgi:hypothetical protein
LLTRASLFAGDAVLLHHAVEVVAIDARTVQVGVRRAGGKQSNHRHNSYGQAIYAAAQKPEGEITEVPSYMFPKPDTLSPTFEKVSFVTKVGDLGCGVGYYK